MLGRAGWGRTEGHEERFVGTLTSESGDSLYYSGIVLEVREKECVICVFLP